MDEKFMDIAIEISKNAKYPYGAIVVKDNQIIGRSDEKTLMEKSMYSHAELEAIESASKKMKNFTQVFTLNPNTFFSPLLIEGFSCAIIILLTSSKLALKKIKR